MDPKTQLTVLFREAVAKIAPEAADTEIHFERPRDATHGDLATNIAMQLARKLKRDPRRIADELLTFLRPKFGGHVETAEVAGAGFINIRLKRASKTEIVREILEAGTRFGRSKAVQPSNIQVEFVSANPTGPLHLGHGRQAALGDAIAALLEAQGHQVTREFYYNDAGAQIHNLALSVRARAHGIEPDAAGWPPDGYKGDYIREIADAFTANNGDANDLEAIRAFAVAFLRGEQDVDLQKFGVEFDVYTLESSLYAEGKVDALVRSLVASGKTYEKDGALWLRTTEYGDDKDRVVRKSDGSYTYFVPDTAYHVAKWERGFRKVINVQGTDHHSTVTRVRAGLQALGIGIPKDYPQYVLHSLVRVVRNGEEVKISKRAGSYVTVRDLIDWVGRDAVRFFLVSRRADSEFVFDVDLALARSEENPVYYVQYAHARVCSVLAQWGGDPATLAGASLAPLALERELALARRLAEYPETVSAAAREFAPHSIAFFLRGLAGEFHAYYNDERILVEDPFLAVARLALCAAVRQVLENGLALLGVSAPERM